MSNQSESKTYGFVNANLYQVLQLNKLLPLGFKIELEETVQRTMANKSKD